MIGAASLTASRPRRWRRSWLRRSCAQRATLSPPPFRAPPCTALSARPSFLQRTDGINVGGPWCNLSFREPHYCMVALPVASLLVTLLAPLWAHALFCAPLAGAFFHALLDSDLVCCPPLEGVCFLLALCNVACASGNTQQTIR